MGAQRGGFQRALMLCRLAPRRFCLNSHHIQAQCGWTTRRPRRRSEDGYLGEVGVAAEEAAKGR